MVPSQSHSKSQAGEQRYRHLFEHMPICIFVADLTATPPTLLEANRRAELVFSYTAAELVGIHTAQLVPEDARLAVLSIVQQGQTVTTETTDQRRDGTRFPVLIIAAPNRTHRRLIPFVALYHTCTRASSPPAAPAPC